MKNDLSQSIKQSQADLRRLQKEHLLPPLMELKLVFLEAIITSAPQINDLAERLDPQQRETIEELNHETRQYLFVNIIQCLSGREVITYFQGQRAYLRRQGKFFAWQKCYLNCNTNKLVLLPKRDTLDIILKFQLKVTSMSRQYTKYKGRSVITLESEGKKSVIGFDEEITCKRIHKTLEELIQQHREWNTTKFDTQKFNEQREAKRLALPAYQVKQIIDQEEYDYLLGLEKRIKEIDMLLYEHTLLKNLEEGRILKSSKGTAKTQVILKGITPVQAASCYLQLKEWNPSIEKLQISGRLRKNCLIGKLKTKSYSFFSYPRQAEIIINYLKPCQCQNKKPTHKTYLLLQDFHSEQETQATVRMDLQQVIQFLPNQDDPSLLLVSVFTKAGFNGFCSESDNQNMTLHFVENLTNFYRFTQHNFKKYEGYFEDVPCPCGGIRPLDFLTDVSLPTQHQQSERLSVNESPNKRINEPILTNIDVLRTLQDVCNGEINEDFLDIISKKIHYSYYLQHRFSDKNSTFVTFLGENKNFLMEGTRWRIDKDSLTFIDAQALAAQKDMLKMLLKQISSNIMQGKSVMNMSLPVQIFDKISFLDAISQSYGFFPHYASKMLATNDPIQRIKNLVCGIEFVHATRPNIQKPFNPILGQTYQGKLGQFQVYVQQISHHPPISALLITNNEIEFSGNIEVMIDMGLNSLSSYLCHWLRVKILKDNSEYLIKVPDVTIQGLNFGQRSYRVIGKGCILDLNNNLFCELSFGKEKKRVYQSKQKIQKSDILGGIFKVKQQFTDKLKTKPKLKSFEGIKAEQILQTCCLLTGKWFGEIYFDEICYKSLKNGPFPYRSQRMKYLLPSDSIWRQDVIFKLWQNNEKSNQQKQRLQNLQRNDRKLREHFKKGK